MPLEAGSVYRLRKDAENHVLPYFGRMRLVDITPRDCDRWWDQLDHTQCSMCVNALKVLKAVLATASKPGRNGESALIPANSCMIPTPGQKRETETVPATRGPSQGHPRPHARQIRRHDLPRRVLQRSSHWRDLHPATPRHRPRTSHPAHPPQPQDHRTTNRHEIPTQRIRTRPGPRQTHRQPHPTPDTIQTLRQRIQTNNDEIQRLQEENRQLEQRIAALADSDGVSSM